MSTAEAVESLKVQLIRSKYDASLVINDHIKGIGFEEGAEKTLNESFDILLTGIEKIFSDLTTSVDNLAKSSSEANFRLIGELENHLSSLDTIRLGVNNIEHDFKVASEEAVKIGERLVIAEKERKIVDNAIELMKHVRYFETCSKEDFQNLNTLNSEQLRKLLPHSIRTLEWGEISQTLFDLKKILYDINSDEVQNAQVIS